MCASVYVYEYVRVCVFSSYPFAIAVNMDSICNTALAFHGA